MARKLYVLSEDGGAREDCNIFYAKYLLMEELHEADLAKLLGGKIETHNGTNDIKIPREPDGPDVDEGPIQSLLYDVYNKLVPAAAAAGFTVELIDTCFVIQEGW